jgi:hypothetical protein
VSSENLLREAAYLRRIGETEAALEILKEAAIEIDRETLATDPLTKPRFNLSLVKRRTRFFIKYAKRHSVRLSALAYLVAVHTRKNWKRGLRDHRGGWHQNSAWFAQQLGITKRQVFRLVEQATSLFLLNYRRTGRGIIVWVVEPGIFKELKRSQTVWGEDKEYAVGFYYKRLANLLGINSSIIYLFLRDPIVDDDGKFLHIRRVTAEDVPFHFPWMRPASVRSELERLEHFGVIQRELHGKGYRYFWKKRSDGDRKKWLEALLSDL